MFKKSLLVSTLALSVAMGVQAETFTTSVDVTKTLTPITITEKTAMVLPALNVDDGTPVNTALCNTQNFDYFPGLNYCGTTGSNGVYTINGAASAAVTVTFQTAPVIKNGIKFYTFSTVDLSNTLNLTTNTSGVVDLTLLGYMELSDLSAVTTGNTVFDIPVTAVYQ